MERNHIIVEEYLKSLREDKELDMLLPILLRLMGFKIIRSALEAKGQNQQGRDIIAEGKDGDGTRRRFYFEVKGHSDRNITEASITKPDGIADSLLSAYLTNYVDLGIPNFNNIPVKVILVHNGTVKPSATDLLNGVVTRHFRDPTTEFERWGIYELTDRFSKYLFSEYLLTDEGNLKLFKKTLALLDQPEYDLRDYKALVDHLLSKNLATDTRAFSKLFSTLNLSCVLLWHNAKECNNLLHAMNGVAYTVLKTWAWILKNKAARKKAVVREFKKLLAIQRDLLAAYFEKTLPVAQMPDGLFSETGGPFEEIGYSLRSFDYISWLLYYYSLEQAGETFSSDLEDADLIFMQRRQKETVVTIVNQNTGTKTPIIDRHSRPIALLTIFMLGGERLLKSEAIWTHNYLFDILNKLELIKTLRKRLPELYDNLNAVIEFVASGIRPTNYQDGSSMLLLILLELWTIFKNENGYAGIRTHLYEGLDLQTAYPSWTENAGAVEQALFEGSIYEQTILETDIKLPDTLAEFRQQVIARGKHPIAYQTDAVGLRFLRTLSYIYFYNDVPPDEWRLFLRSPLMAIDDTVESEHE